MKKFLKFASVVLLAALAVAAQAQTYPYTNPTYIPNAVGPTNSYAAPADYAFNTLGIGTVTVRVTGTCTSLAAVAQATIDGTNYTAVNLYPIATGTSAPTAVASISAVGFWKVNTTGFTGVRLHITALTAACVVTLAGTPHGFNGTTF